MQGVRAMSKTLAEYAEDIRAERAAQLEREIAEEATARVAADAERSRYATLAAEVGLAPDAPPAEVTRLHNLKASQFWDRFVNFGPSTFGARFKVLAAELGVDLEDRPDNRLFDPRTAVWNAMRAKGHPETKRPLDQAA